MTGQRGISAPAGPHTGDRNGTGFAARLRRQFREVLKHLTARAPRPGTRRRGKRTGEGFSSVARSLLARRDEPAGPVWDVWVLMQLWPYNEFAGTDLGYDCIQGYSGLSRAPGP